LTRLLSLPSFFDQPRHLPHSAVGGLIGLRWPQGLLDLWRKGELQGGELLVKGGLVSFELRGVVLGCLAAGRTAPRFFFFLALWPID